MYYFEAHFSGEIAQESWPEVSWVAHTVVACAPNAPGGGCGGIHALHREDQEAHAASSVTAGHAYHKKNESWGGRRYGALRHYCPL